MAHPERGSLRIAPFTFSALFHALLATVAFYSLRQPKPVALPPMYRVEIVAAPAGERAIGEVKTAEPKTTRPVTTPTLSPSTVKKMPLPKAKPSEKVAKRATPVEAAAEPKVQPQTEAPKAGGGPTGGKGTDVATVRTEGIDFAFPGYLNNIVRQIALNFRPRNPNARLKADVRFLIHRDGSVSDLKFISRSGVFSFDLEAQGAIEAASSARRFGPLPAAFPDDVLPVVFSFDPEFLK